MKKMKSLILLLIFIGIGVHGYPSTYIQHHPEANDNSALRRRFTRSGTYEEPLKVSQKKAYLQTGHTYELPCTVIRPADSVSIIYWFKGESQDPALRTLILRQSYPNDGLNFAEDKRYQISSTYGIIIDPVNSNDTDIFWCKTVRKLNQFVEDYLNVTVLDKTFPKEGDSIVDETSVSLNIENENTIRCQLLPQAPTQIDKTVYWSILTDNSQILETIFAKFANGDTLLVEEYAGTHGPEGNNGLYIKSFKKRDERYCCHVFEQGNDLRTSCIDVTWLALATEKRPTILDCDSMGETCEVEISPHQDYLQLECSINEAYPKPTLNWSYTNCKERPTFFTTSSSTENPTNEVFNVQSKVYLVGLQPSFDDCSLVCTAHGEAIPDQTEPASVTITRLTETTTPRIVTSTHTCPGNNSSSFLVPFCVTFGFLVVLFLIDVVLICPKSRKFVKNRFGTFRWFPEQNAIPNVQNYRTNNDQTSSEETKMMMTTPLMSTGDEDNGVAEERVCLENRGSDDVDITDPNFIWNYEGQLLTEPVPEIGNETGFKAITDVIGIQDGGMVVIDSNGLHRFTVEYHYRVIDLYEALGNRGHTCVAHFMDDKLLFGLQWGKLVIVNIVNEQVGNFASVYPVKDKTVQLASIAVSSLGYVFASDENGKTISVFDHEGAYLKRLDTHSIQPGSLALHIRREALSFFVTSGEEVRKYHISGEKRQSMINHAHHFDINKETLEMNRFKPCHISVQNDRLLVVSRMGDPQLLLVLQLNANNGHFQQNIVAKALGIRGIKFISGGDRLVLYTGNSVYVFEKGKAKQMLKRPTSVVILDSHRSTQIADAEAVNEPGTSPSGGSKLKRSRTEEMCRPDINQHSPKLDD